VPERTRLGSRPGHGVLDAVRLPASAGGADPRLRAPAGEVPDGWLRIGLEKPNRSGVASDCFFGLAVGPNSRNHRPWFAIDFCTEECTVQIGTSPGEGDSHDYCSVD
jgi:hypothetical protein